MVIRRLTLYVGLSLQFLSGCTPDNRVGPLETKVVQLEARVQQLELNLKLQAEVKDWDSIAYLTPGSEGYAAVKMDLGYLTVNLADVNPYANGSKVSLTFGNLTSATIDGLKMKLEWGSVDDKGVPKNDDAKSREVSVAEPLLSGAWNKTEVVLEGVPPSALGFVRVREVTHRGIRLRGQMK